MSARLLDVPATAIRLTPASRPGDEATDLAAVAAALVQGHAPRPTLIEVSAGVFEVLIGEREVRAGVAAGWATIPALVEEQLDRIAGHTRRLSEHLHRRELGPLDEARAIKLGWLCANAVALDHADQVNAALAAGSLRDRLEAVAALLADAPRSANRPPVTQEAYLAESGLGISKAALRKKLQVLNLSESAQARLDALKLSEAGIRAFLRLGAADQDALLQAIDAEPSLAARVSAITQDVVARGQPLALALARARQGGGSPECAGTTGIRPRGRSTGVEARAGALAQVAADLLICAEEAQEYTAALSALLAAPELASLPQRHAEAIGRACRQLAGVVERLRAIPIAEQPAEPA